MRNQDLQPGESGNSFNWWMRRINSQNLEKGQTAGSEIPQLWLTLCGTVVLDMGMLEAIKKWVVDDSVGIENFIFGNLLIKYFGSLLIP